MDDYTRDPDIRPMLDKQTGKLVGYLDFDSLNVLELEDDEPYYLRCTVCGAIGDVTLNSFREFPPAHSKCLDASEVPIFDFIRNDGKDIPPAQYILPTNN